MAQIKKKFIGAGQISSVEIDASVASAAALTAVSQDSWSQLTLDGTTQVLPVVQNNKAYGLTGSTAGTIFKLAANATRKIGSFVRISNTGAASCQVNGFNDNFLATIAPGEVYQFVCTGTANGDWASTEANTATLALANAASAQSAATTAQASADGAASDAAAAQADATQALTNAGTAQSTANTANAAAATAQAAANNAQSQAAAAQSTADAAIPASEKGANSGVATLDGSGKIPNSQIPAIAISSTFFAASQVAQLALGAQEGDFVYRSDQSQWYIHNGGVAGTMADFGALTAPAAVQSVNSQTGVVVLTTADLAEQTNLFFTNARARTAAVEDTINDGVMDKAPSQNAVYDALQLKADAFTGRKETKTLIAGDITAQYVDLAFLAKPNTVMASVDGVLGYEGEDYTLSTVGGVTRLSFIAGPGGDWGTGGAAALVATDKLRVQYLS